jgi:hypothetical protein
MYVAGLAPEEAQMKQLNDVSNGQWARPDGYLRPGK